MLIPENCTRDFECCSSDHDCPYRITKREAFARGENWRPEPTLLDIIENHRAVCTASAEQIADLVRQLVELNIVPVRQLAGIRRDAQRQLENVRATAAIFTAGVSWGSAVDQAERIWRRQNPALSEVVGNG